ncbi:MAG: ABC transporter substrate-binding protein [Methanomicrobiales archaeon]|jgi:iron complex transport system substrate-binding protein|nr:ABC transporter substrate-binding protein [Methanomicrobiales archaeon]
MKEKIFLITFSMLLLACVGTFCTAAAAEIQFTDTAGSLITLPDIAQRVVCLNSDAAEVMVALGVGDRVVGVTDSTMRDNALMAHLPQAVSVGTWDTPSLENVLKLDPDAIIIYSSSPPKNVALFETAGIKLIALDCYRITTMESDVAALGMMFGAEDKAAEYIDFFNSWKEMITLGVSAIPDDEIPTVYVEGYTEYAAQGVNSGIDLMLSIAKGTNIASELGEQWPKVTPEWVLMQDPAIIIKVCSPTDEVSTEDVWNNVMTREGFEVLQAVQNEDVFVINGDLAYGPRSIAGLVYVAQALHLSLDIDPTDVLLEYDERFVSGMSDLDYFSPYL